MAEWLSVQFTDCNEKLTFFSHAEALAWMQEELSAWEWLWTTPRASGTQNPEDFHRFKSSLITLQTALAIDYGGETRHIMDLQNKFYTAFQPQHQYSLPPSRSAKGMRIIAIKDTLGPDVGRWALRLEKGSCNLGEVKNSGDITAIIAATTFNDTAWGKVGDSLREERSRYRDEVTKLEARVRQIEHERSEERLNSATHIKALTRRLLHKSEARWKKSEAEITSKITKAIEDIEFTDHIYKRQMALLAPVLYWKEKAKSHAKWELVYAVLCAAYFLGAAYSILTTARAAILFLETQKGQNLASVYVITGGALLGGTTLLFWIGRVIVKLFLSEHHLRSDCQEKAVMTQAYLSMDTNERFGEADRTIVLASIFRSTPDGIVKDEGPADIAGTAVLAKLLSR